MADAPKLSGKQRAAAAAAAACLVCVPFTASFEGLRTRPYRDPGNPNLWTVCYGETERAMRTYSPQECADLLHSRQLQNYAPAVQKCVPAFADDRYRNAYAASVDAAYNAGIRAFCRSRMARAFNAGQWQQGCEGFRGWYVTGGGKQLPGLVRRRNEEAKLCLKG